MAMAGKLISSSVLYLSNVHAQTLTDPTIIYFPWICFFEIKAGVLSMELLVLQLILEVVDNNSNGVNLFPNKDYARSNNLVFSFYWYCSSSRGQ